MTLPCTSSCTVVRPCRRRTTALRGERGEVLLAVVVDADGVAFDVFVDAFALLAEIRQVAAARRAGGVLIALRVLRHFDTIGLDHDRAFGRDDVAGEDVDLLQVVVGHVVRFDVERLVLVGAFRVGARREAGERQRDECGREPELPARRRGATAVRADGRNQDEGTIRSCSHTWDGITRDYLDEPPLISDAAIAPRTLPKSFITRVTLL